MPGRQLEALEQALPELCPSPQQRQQALAMINPQHRRSVAPQQASKLHPSVRRLHNRLLRQPLPRRWPASQPPFEMPSDERPGPPELWADWLAAHSSYPAPRLTEKFSLAAECQLSVCGPSWLELRPHLLMQRLPLPALGQGRVDFERSRLHQLQLMRSADPVEQPAQIPAVVEQLTLNLELPPLQRASHWLAIFNPAADLRSRTCAGVAPPALDCRPADRFRGRGERLVAEPQAVDSHQWAARLGLTPPTEGELQVLGSAGAGFERGLIQEMTTPVHEGTNASSPAIAYWPGWPELVIEDPAAGLLRAGWLQTAAQRAARLVSASAVHCPDEWDLLQATSPCLAHPSDAPPVELRARHGGQPLMALAEDRPTPPLQTLREWQIPDLDQRPPQAAVVVSLHNDADRIANALQT